MTRRSNPRKVEKCTPGTLRNFSAHNPPRHSQNIVEPIARLIRRHGFTSPILVDEDDFAIDGAARLAAVLAARCNRGPAS